MAGHYQEHSLVPESDFARRRPGWRFAVVPTTDDLNAVFARELVDLVAGRNARGELTKVILPVGPLGFRPFARLCNVERVSCRNLVVFMMDEFCGPDDRYIPPDHPLSFHAFVGRELVSALDPDLRIPEDQVVFPDPRAPEAVGRRMAELGGVDVCYGGFGINGHFAFNDPPEPGEPTDLGSARASTARLVTISRESLTQTAMGATGGDLELVPRRAVTLGMKELLAAREMHLTFMRVWHAAVMRRALFGPVTPSFPASLLQTHPRVRVTMTSYVAALPQLKVTQTVGG